MRMRKLIDAGSREARGQDAHPKLIRNVAVGLGLLLASSTSLQADRITYEWRGVIQGTFNGQTLPLTLYTVTAFRDDPEYDYPQGGDIPVVWFSEPPRIALAGIGEFEFEFSAYIVYSGSGPNTGQVGMEGPPPAIGGIISGPRAPGLFSYDLLTSIGPVPGWGSFEVGPYETSGGILEPIYDPGRFFTFSATRVPEPSSVILWTVAAGLAAAVGRRR